MGRLTLFVALVALLSAGAAGEAQEKKILVSRKIPVARTILASRTIPASRKIPAGKKIPARTANDEELASAKLPPSAHIAFGNAIISQLTASHVVRL